MSMPKPKPKKRYLEFVKKWKEEEKKDHKEGYLSPSFYFTVGFLGNSGALDSSSPEDNSFFEVSGLKAEMDLEPVSEGGENRFVYQLPKGMKASKLSLKRGVVGMESPMVKWCKSVLEGGFVESIQPMDLSVRLLDRSGDPLRIWDIIDAYPISWDVEGFNSSKNEIAIEKIDLNYLYANRVG